MPILVSKMPSRNQKSYLSETTRAVKQAHTSRAFGEMPSMMRWSIEARLRDSMLVDNKYNKVRVCLSNYVLELPFFSVTLLGV